MKPKKTLLGNALIKTGAKEISIPEYIRAHAKTRRVAILRKQFEDLIENDRRFTRRRSSQIFVSKRMEKYYPIVNGYYYGHLLIN